MKAWAVIGANFGDESKGKHVDYLCHRHGADLVVRFNGGAQAGHTVVAPDGRRHVFHHLGSGTFLGVPTYLSRFFVCNPVPFNQELPAVQEFRPRVFVDKACLVTTPWDMVVNQTIENHRGALRHGSCGVGFNQTIARHAALPLTVWHLKALAESVLRARLVDIASYSAVALEDAGVENVDAFRDTWCTERVLDNFAADCGNFLSRIEVAAAPSAKRVVFEGAQGLLLDQDNSRYFPYLTRSNTGVRNAAALAREWDVDKFEAIYCTRTYLTRHGAGPLPGEVHGSFPFVDMTNVRHEFQGSLRYAPLDAPAILSLIRRTSADAQSHRVLARVAVSHADQAPIHDLLLRYAHYTSSGPTREDIEHHE